MPLLFLILYKDRLMILNTLKAVTNLAESSLGLVNTALNAGACGINSLNQAVQPNPEPSNSYDSMATTSFLRQSFTKYHTKPVQPKITSEYISIEDNYVVIGKDTKYSTNVPMNQVDKLISVLKNPKMIYLLQDLYMQITRGETIQSLTLDTVTLWTDVQANQQEWLDVLDVLLDTQRDLIFN